MPPLRPSLLLLATTLVSCSSMQIRTEPDPTVSFAAYRTYAWIAATPGPEQAAPMRDPQVRALIVAALDREMAAKGLVQKPIKDGPDFLVSVLGWSKTEIDVATYGYTSGPWDASREESNTVRQYTEGTLIVDFVDAKSKQLVWRGTATDIITSAESVQKSVDSAAHQLLAAYPPKPK